MRPPAFSYERLAGAAVGTMVGDALGMPVEGMSREEIARRWGWVEEMLPGRLPPGSYTDDSQMMIALLETLASEGRVVPEVLAGRFLANYEPIRGYGGRIHGVMQRLAAGVPWQEAGTDSFGNGGAMRVGVLGAYWPEEERAQQLLAEAELQCRITHHHPRGIAGAQAQAMAVAFAARAGAEAREVFREWFVEAVARAVEPTDSYTASRIRAMPDLAGVAPQQAVERLGRAYACDVTAPESVPAAMGAFLAAASATQAVVIAVALGGDTDTIGAMAGAIAGAYWGVDAWPRRWTQALEKGPKGLEYVLALCRKAVAARGV